MSMAHEDERHRQRVEALREVVEELHRGKQLMRSRRNLPISSGAYRPRRYRRWSRP